jgi:putative intracellular protease/amidase/YHS domain-containing protein
MSTFVRRFPVPFAIVCLALACALGMFAPQSSSARADEAKPVALTGLDPVLLVEGKQTKGQADISVTREGFRYLFANAESKAKFEKEPERYEIQFHGQCAMMRGARAQADLFTVYKGRIYGFGSEACQESFREQPEKYVHARSVVILVFDGMELLDFSGPAEVFVSTGWQVSTVAATDDPVTCAGLVTITPQYTVANCPRADIIVIPGGSRAVSKDKRVTDWVAKAVPQAEATLSVCTGVFVLAQAGLLDGKEATTHHGAIGVLRQQFPKITVHADRRVVDNGNIVTAAGVSSGIDGALHLVDRLMGRSQANATARYMEYLWQPSSPKKN